MRLNFEKRLADLQRIRNDVRLPCPECRMAGRGKVRKVVPRIGSMGPGCGTCNRFAAKTRAIAGKRLRRAHPDEWRIYLLEAERDVYPQVIDDHTRRYYLNDVDIEGDETEE